MLKWGEKNTHYVSEYKGSIIDKIIVESIGKM
jgi:hypothetical protein